ncbi:MAG TPA: helix-turn-helix transcriptional regulator [Usitatibacter sp.]|nr:helix-turn-helix transcriptional regulator [Usitatibacter sp.]
MIEQADLLLRAATVALALTAAAAIASRPRRTEVAGYAAFAVAGIAAFMIASAPGAHATLGLAAFFFNAWCLATPGVVWLLARALFGERGRHEAIHVAALGLLVALSMAGDYGRFRLGPLASWPDAAHMLLLAGRAAALALLFSACAMAILHWRADLVEQRRRARAAFVAIVGCAFAALAGSEFVFGGRGAPLELLLAGHSLLLALSFGLTLVLARGGLAELLSHQPVRGRGLLALVRSDGVDAALARRVSEEMASRKLWQQEGLGIAGLARELGTQEYRLRRAINRHLGYRNFNDFLHDYRLAEAAARLADAAQAHLPVLTIALECGYGSIGPFNRAFKARFGVTPGQFRNQAAFMQDSASQEAKR